VDEPRWGHSACIIPAWDADKVVLFGGWYSESQYRDVHVFDCESHEIECLAVGEQDSSRPSHRAGHSAVARGHHMLVFGGSWCEGGPYKYSNTIFTLNMKTKQWEAPKPAIGEPPRARSQHAVCPTLIRDRYMLIAGGCSGEWIESDIFCLDTKLSLWHRVRLELQNRSGKDDDDDDDEADGRPASVQPKHIETQNFRVTPAQPSMVNMSDDHVLIVGLGGLSASCIFQISTCTLTPIQIQHSQNKSDGDGTMPPLVCQVMHLVSEGKKKKLIVYGGYNPSTNKDSKDLYEIEFQ